MASLYDFTVKNQQGEDVSLADYQGRVLLIVNTATECGFTPTYAQLEELYRSLHERGLDILDFPCDQFGHQAPGTDEEIAQFCTSRFGVTFPQLSKIEVNGQDADPLFTYLQGQKAFEGFDEGHELTPILEDLLAKADPDYASCVDLCTKGALHEMVVPSLLAIVVPVVTGLILGAEAVVGLLGGVTVTGFVVAVFMSNAGGAWDNAKKYIESGTHGGKGSDCHKAAVIGDTVGDPFKDTSGPSLNILIKLCSTVSIVFSGLITSIHLLG